MHKTGYKNNLTIERVFFIIAIGYILQTQGGYGSEYKSKTR
jgi:hypothetical protein